MLPSVLTCLMTKDQNPGTRIQRGEETQHGSLIGQYLLKLFSNAVNGREIFKNTAALMEFLLYLSVCTAQKCKRCHLRVTLVLKWFPEDC